MSSVQAARPSSFTADEVEAAKLQVKVLEKLGRVVDHRLRSVAAAEPSNDETQATDQIESRAESSGRQAAGVFLVDEFVEDLAPYPIGSFHSMAPAELLAAELMEQHGRSVDSKFFRFVDKLRKWPQEEEAHTVHWLVGSLSESMPRLFESQGKKLRLYGTSIDIKTYPSSVESPRGIDQQALIIVPLDVIEGLTSGDESDDRA